MSRNIITLFFILITHLFPLYGLFYLGWSPFQTVLLFNIETLIMIYYFVLCMCARFYFERNPKVFLFAFLSLVAFQPFNSIHLTLSTLMFGTLSYSIMWPEIHSLVFTGLNMIIPGIILILIRFTFNFIDYIQSKKYINIFPKNGPIELNEIGIRIFFMQFTLIIGGFFGKATGHLAWGASIIVILQLIYSLILFRKHMQLGKIQQG